MSAHHKTARRRLPALFAATLLSAATLLISLAPHASAADASFAVLFPTDQGIGVWNAAAGQVSKRAIRVDGSWKPVAMVAHPDGKRVFALDGATGQIVVIDRVARKMVARTATPPRATAKSLLLSPSGERLYVTYSSSRVTELVVLDATSPALTRLHRLAMKGGGSDAPMTLSADGVMLYFFNQAINGGSVPSNPRVIEIETREAVKGEPVIVVETPLDFRAQDVALSRDEKTLFIAGYGKRTQWHVGVVNFDLSTRKENGMARRIGGDESNKAVEVQVSPTNGAVYTLMYDMLSTDVPANGLTGRYFGPLRSDSRFGRSAFKLSPDGSRAYLAQDGAVRVMDLDQMEVLPAWQVPSARFGPLAVSPVGEVTAKAAIVHGDTWWLAGDDAGENVAPQARSFRFGGAYPLLCDWDGDGVKTPGTFNAATSEWTITNTLPPSNPITFKFGFGPSDWPVCGDWNGDGTQTVGVVNNRIMWHLRNSNSAGAADVALSFDVPLGWRLPIAGDWNGDGTDTPGYFYGATAASANEWFLKNDLRTGRWHHRFVYNPCLEQGKSGCGPIVGDWTGAGFTSVGVVADEPSQVTRNWMLRHSLSSGQADNTFLFGPMKGRALTWR